MEKLKGTKTEQNLMEAFAGESMARNKYSYFSSMAKKEGYVQISNIFAETADNEKEHAKLWFKLFHGIGSTMENLITAADGEHGEWEDMYPRMAREAREEGFEDIAKLFDGVAGVEKKHEERYLKLAENVKNGVVFERDTEAEWKCANCGHRFVGKEAPDVCPVCAHPKAHFELFCQNY